MTCYTPKFGRPSILESMAQNQRRRRRRKTIENAILIAVGAAIGAAAVLLIDINL